MTLYELLKQISNNITPQNDAFFRYAMAKSSYRAQRLHESTGNPKENSVKELVFLLNIKLEEEK